MKIITVTNQKGGTGKTSTVLALMAGLTKRNFKVLAIDLDAQTNLTFTQKADLKKPTALSILTGEANILDAIQHTETGDFIAGTEYLSGADTILKETGREYRLKEALESSKLEYDYILIDTPPALSILTVNALTASNSVIIPAQADFFSVQGIVRLEKTIEPVKKYTNKDLKIEGILLTRYSDRSNLSKGYKEIAQQTADKLKTKLFKTAIRECITIKEAQSLQQSIFDYKPDSNAVADYNSFIDELLEA